MRLTLLVFLVWIGFTNGYDDSASDLEVTYPRDGGTASSPVRFKFIVSAKSSDSVKSQFEDMFVCVELEGVSTQCSLVLDLRIIFQDLPEGNYVARAYLFDGAVRYHETDPLSFAVLSVGDFEAHIDQETEQLRIDSNFPPELNILQWAQKYQSIELIQNISVSQSNGNHSDELLLVIGTKTAVLTNFAQRQAIRETWASKAALPAHVKVFFLGCTPVVENVSDSLHRQWIQDAVNLERGMYGDLLTDELECDDKYTLLTEKVSAFFEWIVAEFPRTKFVMVTDDDVYVRVDKVVAELNTNVQSEGLYVGELPDTLNPAPLSPVRDPTHPYYTSRNSYPLGQFPPYAGGPHYLVSMDCVRFIGKNRYRLASLGGEDTSIGLWLLVIQVHVQHSAALGSMRLWPCKDKFLSFADLSPLGIRSIHSNLLSGRRFCHNFDRIIWGCRRSGTLEDILDSL